MEMVTKATNIANNGLDDICCFFGTRTMVIDGVDKIVAVSIMKEINKTFWCQNC